MGRAGGNKEEHKASADRLRICFRIRVAPPIATSVVIKTAPQMTRIKLSDHAIGDVPSSREM